MNEAVGVLIVDEPPGLEPSLRANLEHTPSLRTIGEEELDHEAFDDPAGGPVALVFVRDAHVGAACERIASLREGRPTLRILVAFRALGAGEMNRLIEAGADAFVGRNMSVREVCNAILALAGGYTSLSDGLDLRVPSSIEAPDSLGLTPREAEVLRFLSAGFSNKEVARRLSLSVRTVETHRLNLRRKTQTGRLKDLVTLARQLGLDPVLDSDNRRVSARH